MLYCYTCGYGNEDGARFCYSCGRQMLVQGSAPQPSPTPVFQPPPHTPRKAIVGVVLGVLAVVMAVSALFGEVGFFIPIVFIFIGLPLSIVGFTQSQRGNRSKIVTTAGITCNSFALCVVIIVALVSAFSSESAMGGSTDLADSGNTENSDSSINVTTLSRSEMRTKEAKEAKDFGIGMNLEKFERDFGDEMGFEFEDSPLEDGRSRKIGKSPNGIATLEMIGPESNLTQVTLTLPLDSSNGDSLALYTMTAFSTVTPDHFAEGLDWFQDTMKTAERVRSVRPDSNDSFVGHLGDTEVLLSLVPNTPVVLLSFMSPDAPLESFVRPTTPPTPTGWNPSKWRTDQYEQKKILNKGHVLWVGAIGNGGLKAGQYEYRDAKGGTVVNESDCYLLVNMGESGLQQELNLEKGKPFQTTLRQVHGYASFGTYYGGTCRGGLYLRNP